MIDLIDCWNNHFYRRFQKEKMGKNHHFMTTLEDFQMQGWQVDANGKESIYFAMICVLCEVLILKLMLPCKFGTNTSYATFKLISVKRMI